MTLKELKQAGKPEGIELDFAPYLITKEGKVWSLIKDRYLKPANNGIGYLQVFLKGYDNKSRWYKLHRLVALTHIPNPENKSDVNHKDGDKANNHVDNLEWLTHQENIQHSFDVLGRSQEYPFFFSGQDHWNYGKTTPDSTKELMSIKKKGENHPKFRGYYSYNGIQSTSMNDLAIKLNTYPMAIRRLYNKGLVQFIPK